MKRRVWFDINDGEFSDSWAATPITNIAVESILKDVEAKYPGNKLIEYECINDEDFNFNSLMKIMTNLKEKN